jgi:GT2 family glycosyltransferase
MWPSDPPAWLTSSFWSPLALVDYGPTGRYVSAEHREKYVTLVGANLAVRREVFDAVGGFDPRYQHEPGAVTACEDHEFELRAVNAGFRGWYEPSALIRAEVQPKRLTKAYHRKWAFDHGRASVRMTPPRHCFDGGCTYTPDTAKARYLFGAPYFAYGELLRLARGYVRALLRRDAPLLLWHDFKLHEYAGALHFYLTTRRRDPEATALAGSAPRVPPARAVHAAGVPGGTS